MGETAAAGGVFMGLGLRGVRGIAAAAAFGTAEQQMGKLATDTRGAGKVPVTGISSSRHMAASLGQHLTLAI